MQKWLRMNVSGTLRRSDPRFYTDGGNGFGSGCKMWVSAAAYATPAVPSTSDDPPHLSGVDMVDAFSYTSAARSLSTRSTPGCSRLRLQGRLCGAGLRGRTRHRPGRQDRRDDHHHLAGDLMVLDPLPFEISGSGITAVCASPRPLGSVLLRSRCR